MLRMCRNGDPCGPAPFLYTKKKKKKKSNQMPDLGRPLADLVRERTLDSAIRHGIGRTRRPKTLNAVWPVVLKNTTLRARFKISE